MRDLVHALKYHGRPELAAPLGRRMGRCSRLGPLVTAQVVVVPATGRRASVRRRGYDHAVLLAAALARERGARCDPGALVRRRQPDRPQAGSDRTERRRLVRGSFAARPERVAGQIVALVDDVMSTGATADAATRALLCAGARQVRVVTLAT